MPAEISSTESVHPAVMATSETASPTTVITTTAIDSTAITPAGRTPAGRIPAPDFSNTNLLSVKPYMKYHPKPTDISSTGIILATAPDYTIPNKVNNIYLPSMDNIICVGIMTTETVLYQDPNVQDTAMQDTTVEDTIVQDTAPTVTTATDTTLTAKNPMKHGNYIIESIHMGNHRVTKLKLYDHLALSIKTTTHQQILLAVAYGTLNILVTNGMVLELNYTYHDQYYLFLRKPPDEPDSSQNDYSLQE